MNKIIRIAGNDTRWVGKDACTRAMVVSHTELPLIERLCGLLAPDDILYDIGSCAGTYAIPASYWCSQVIAFEPFKDHLNALQQHVVINHRENILCVGMALGPKEEKRIIYSAPSLCPTLHKEPGSVRHIIPCTTLDLFTQTHLMPTVLKIDIEGGEVGCLEGGRELLKNHPPRMIQLEIHTTLQDRPDYLPYLEGLLSMYSCQVKERRRTELETLWTLR